MERIVWTLLMVAAFIAVGYVIRRATTRKRRRKRA